MACWQLSSAGFCPPPAPILLAAQQSSPELTRVPLCCFAPWQVRRFEEYMYGNSPRFSEVTA